MGVPGAEVEVTARRDPEMRDWWHAFLQYLAGRAADPPQPPPPPEHRPAAPDILAPPPMVDGDTLRDWMVHHHRSNGNVWQSVVGDFYARAAADPEIAAYFVGVDMAELQRHFMRALVVVTHIGLTVRAADALGARHEHLHIRAEHFDRVVGVLTDVLADYGVPRSAVLQLVPVTDVLRRRIVTTPERTP